MSKKPEGTRANTINMPTELHTNLKITVAKMGAPVTAEKIALLGIATVLRAHELCPHASLEDLQVAFEVFIDTLLEPHLKDTADEAADDAAAAARSSTVKPSN